MSQWVIIIREWKATLRFMVVVTSLLLVLFLFSLLFFKYVIRQTDGPTEFTAGTNGITIKYVSANKKVTSKIINVSANKMFTDTGISLEKGDSVKISATGMVETGSFFNWDKIFKRLPESLIDFLIMGRCQLEKPLKSPVRELAKELLKIQLRDDFSFAWRDPEGTPIYFFNKGLLELDEGNKEIIKSYRLHKERDYGTLIAYLAYPDEISKKEEDDPYPFTRDLTESQIIAIGKKMEIHFTDNSIQVFPSKDDKRGSIKPIKVEEERTTVRLYLSVNDCIMDKNRFESLIKREGYFKNEYEFTHSFYSIKEFYEPKFERTDWENSLRAVWYWNNRGAFTVVLEKTEK